MSSSADTSTDNAAFIDVELLGDLDNAEDFGNGVEAPELVTPVTWTGHIMSPV
ncbi:MAG: hypothetical protein IIB28_04945 [Chloroflexi bacterium]|nr:hypothetical protein [Chloroflexota bacterium]